MPERQPEGVGDPLAERVYEARAGLTALLADAARARVERAEVSREAESGAVCAWNHFENIPTFYNWNNRPR
jgi:hypothetical protein